MKAWVHYGFNDMRLEEVPDPKVKAGHAVVRIRVVQPSITEVLVAKGLATFPKLLEAVKGRFAEGTPIQLFGHEFCGEVLEVGAGVSHLKAGDRVTAKASVPCHACCHCRSGRYHFCSDVKFVGFHLPGVLAEYALLPAEILYPLPAAISDSAGATLQPLGECVTAVASMGLCAGERVVVLGQGAMGLASMQAARVLGAGRLIVTDIRDECLELAQDLGADETINARDTDPVERVLELTAGAGADTVIDAASGSPQAGLSGLATFFQAVDMVSPGGKILEVSHFEKPVEHLATGPFRMKSIKWIFPDFSSDAMMRYTIDLVASGRIRQEPAIRHVVEGIEHLPEVFEMTANKAQYRTLNPAQLRLA